MNESSRNMSDDANDEPIDLSALDPSHSTASHEQRVTAIMRASASQLAQRRATAVWSRQVVQWRKPLLAACTLAAAASLVVLVQPSSRSTIAAPAPSTTIVAGDDQPSSIAEAIGVPASIAQMMAGGDSQQLLLSSPTSR